MPNVFVNLIKGLLGRTDAPVLPASSSEEEALRDLRAFIEREVAAGFTPPEEIARTAVECLAGEAEEAVLQREAPQMARNALAAHGAAQAHWPEVTDCDKLDAAFAALEASGVISRQNFSCCGTCGATEIWDEIDEAKRQGRPARGYAFFHQQDTERAAEGGGLYLNYGAYEDDPEAAVAVGHEIAQALEVKGLKVDWDGQIEKRIGVQLDWKRRTVFREG